MAVKMIHLPELAVHRLSYKERHFVLCWKYLGTFCGFEVEEIFSSIFSFTSWGSQGQFNIPSLEQLFTYKRLLEDWEVEEKISLPVGKYNSTVPLCCPCSLSEEEININSSSENLNKVWKSSETLGRTRWGSCRIPIIGEAININTIIGVLKARLNSSPDALPPVFLWEWGTRSFSVVSLLFGFCGSQTVPGWEFDCKGGCSPL